MYKTLPPTREQKIVIDIFKYFLLLIYSLPHPSIEIFQFTNFLRLRKLELSSHERLSVTPDIRACLNFMLKYMEEVEVGHFIEIKKFILLTTRS